MYYDESYQDYIRSILGYPNINNNNNMHTYSNDYEDDYYSNKQDNRSELEDLYPEIYKIVYPMITKRCSEIKEPLTKELLDDITDEIHSAVEVNNEINVNINLNNQTKTTRNEIKRNEISSESKQVSNKEPIRDSRGGEKRQSFNRDLRDLIKILLIRELTGRPGFRPRPPRPPRPPMRPPIFDGRPPFPGGMPGSRPPMRPRDYYDNDLYEQY